MILEITATDEDARRAQRTAQAYALAMSDMIGELETRRGDQEPLVKATVVDSAGLPTTPISPRPLRNLALGIVLGCLIGAALAVARQLLDTSITGIDDVAELTEVPILGNIFDSTAARGIPRRVLGEANPWGESFRVLRTNMQYVGVDSDRKVIVVTSPLQGEGKSTTAISLAVTFAQTNVRTVLVECDLRRPSLAGRLGLDDSVGTTSVLIGRVALADALQQYASTDLMTLTSGPIPPNPSELLQSHSMENLLAELRSDFDVVVLDTPPLLPVTDASILAAQADGALVVVRHGHTTREQLRLSIDRLETVGSKPLGIVLNMTPAKSGVSQGYGYGYGASATNTDEPGHHRQTVGRRRREA